MKNNFLRKIREFISTYKRYGSFSYSQCGEDIIVQFLFNRLGISKIRYLDIGAYHPTALSNTYLFYRKGFEGVCVEPNVVQCNQIKRKRSRDMCLCIGVAGNDSDDGLNFYSLQPKSLSTFSKDEVDINIKNGSARIEKVYSVKVLSLNTIIDKYFVDDKPNYISLDVEGLDFDILSSYEFSKHKPAVLCVETSLPTTDGLIENKSVNHLMTKQGYLIYANTGINTIYVNEDLWHSRRS